jgi:hypothetical protein
MRTGFLGLSPFRSHLENIKLETICQALFLINLLLIALDTQQIPHVHSIELPMQT